MPIRYMRDWALRQSHFEINIREPLDKGLTEAPPLIVHVWHQSLLHVAKGAHMRLAEEPWPLENATSGRAEPESSFATGHSGQVALPSLDSSCCRDSTVSTRETLSDIEL